MAHKQTIDNYEVIFENEKSYLNAKIEYLQLHDDPTSIIVSMSFLEFLQLELYNKDKCRILSIIEKSKKTKDFKAYLEEPFCVYTKDLGLTESESWTSYDGSYGWNGADCDTSSSTSSYGLNKTYIPLTITNLGQFNLKYSDNVKYSDNEDFKNQENNKSLKDFPEEPFSRFDILDL